MSFRDQIMNEIVGIHLNMGKPIASSYWTCSVLHRVAQLHMRLWSFKQELLKPAIDSMPESTINPLVMSSFTREGLATTT